MFKPNFPLELLSPAKDEIVAKAAIDSGADALYIGGPDFSARSAASNSWETIERVCSYSHRYKAKTYLALNTVLLDNELEAARDAAWKAYEAGVDALIIQDMAFLEMDLPPLELHASTQCDIRMPEKVAFLDSLGFSQIVLARELTLEEIAACRAAAPRARLEFFVHGALCVCYSGQCYLSAATRGRSANRGRCAQLCRLPYDVYDFQGIPIKKECYALSLRDNDQSENLEALIKAGVTSFKIEGRLKDATYVKNITAFYRRKLDHLMEKYGWEKASLGTSSFTFTPEPTKTFHRGKTDAFVNGRPELEAELRTPKSVGERIGRVIDIDSFNREIAIDVIRGKELNNGDGLAYFTDSGAFNGLRVNKAVKRGNFTLVSTFEAGDRLRELKKGTQIYRNSDRVFLQALDGDASQRTIEFDAVLDISQTGLSLTVKAAGYEVRETLTLTLDPAKNPEKTREAITKAISKTGDTPFTLKGITITGLTDRFIPVSFLNDLRRKALTLLEEKISERQKPYIPGKDPTQKIDTTRFATDFRANVTNHLAKVFWAKHGVTVSEMGFEVNPSVVNRELMRCRYCLRNELGLCPKFTKGSPEAKERFKESNAGHLKPEPMTLVDPKGFHYKATFDCKACEMILTLEKSPTGKD